MLIGLIEVFALTVLLYSVYQYLKPKPPKGFPPGPANYPIVGGLLSVLSLGQDTAERFRKLGEIYGPVVGLYAGKQPLIVINDFEAGKEVFNREEFSHRPHFFQQNHTHGGRELGVFLSNGELWKEQRRFTLRNLRDFGFGKSSAETLIHEETEACLDSMEKALKNSSNSVINVEDKFGVSILNILWAVLSGKRFSHDDEKFKHILYVIQKSFKSGNATGSLINDYPWLAYVPIVNSGFKDFMASFHSVQAILKVTLEEHKKTRDPNFSRDFIDVYLKEMEDEKRKGNTNSTFFEDQLLAICADLFNAGAESTSNTVAFAVLYALLYPEAQEKLHEELDRVVGKSRLPSYNDKPNLPYLEAFMTECYRMNPIAPNSVPHANIEDVKLNGHVIPKNSFILVNMSATHYDKKYWGDPLVFRAERFLDKDGKYVKTDRVIPFGRGKRVCLGEPLARMSAFILFAAVIQKYKFEIPEGDPRPSTNHVDGFTVSPKPFKAKLTPRF